VEQLSAGTYYGAINRKFNSNELLVSDAIYTLEKVDWHYHENPYFTFILEGNLLEGSKKGIHHCAAGDLLFHNWQDPHYNRKPDGCTRGFHIELSPNWHWNEMAALHLLEGNMDIHLPEVRLLFHKLFWESFDQDNSSGLAMDSLLLHVFSVLHRDWIVSERKVPQWVYTLRDYLRANFSSELNLTTISHTVDLHPVYLSREFSRYFGVTMGDYIRKLKVENAVLLLREPTLSLTEIGYQSGFADQSLFIRCFKSLFGSTPGEYRNKINA
jgi:AraC family transcriptional regulator